MEPIHPTLTQWCIAIRPRSAPSCPADTSSLLVVRNVSSFMGARENRLTRAKIRYIKTKQTCRFIGALGVSACTTSRVCECAVCDDTCCEFGARSSPAIAKNAVWHACHLANTRNPTEATSTVVVPSSASSRGRDNLHAILRITCGVHLHSR